MFDNTATPAAKMEDDPVGS